jgi:hypothetical protein
MVMPTLALTLERLLLLNTGLPRVVRLPKEAPSICGAWAMAVGQLP